MKKLIILVSIAAILCAVADICRTGEPRCLSNSGIRIKAVKVDSSWKVCEDVPLFSRLFAELPYPDSLLNYAEHRNLAIAVARTIAAELGSTNDIRIAHRVCPSPVATNLADAVRIWLNTEDVTDEVVPLFAPCTVHGVKPKGKQKQ